MALAVATCDSAAMGGTESRTGGMLTVGVGARGIANAASFNEISNEEAVR